MTVSTEETLLHQFRRCMNLLRSGLHHFAHSDEGMHHGQGKVLSMLMGREGISQRELAELMQIRPPSLSEALDHLEANSFIERHRNEKDKRMTNVFLTESGRRHAVHADALRHNAAVQLFGALTPDEQQQLSHLLLKVSYALERQFTHEHHKHHKHHEHHKHHKHHGRHEHHDENGSHAESHGDQLQARGHHEDRPHSHGRHGHTLDDPDF